MGDCIQWSGTHDGCVRDRVWGPSLGVHLLGGSGSAACLTKVHRFKVGYPKPETLTATGFRICNPQPNKP